MDPEDEELPEGWAPIDDEPAAQAPKAPPDAPLSAAEVEARRRAVTGDTGPTETSLLGDLWTSLSGAGSSIIPGSAAQLADARVQDRARRALSEALVDPAAVARGAVESVPMSHRLGAVATARAAPHTTGSRGGLSLARDQPPELPYADALAEIDADQAAAQERSPHAFGAGEIGGFVATAPLLGGEEAASTGLGRLAQAGRTGALWSALGGASETRAPEEGDVEGTVRDIARPVPLGTLLGGGLGLAGEAGRGIGQGVRREADAADDLLLAAHSGGRGASLSPRSPEMRQWGSPAQRAAHAEDVRRAGTVGAFSTPADIAEASARERGRIGTEELGPMRKRFDAAGGRFAVPDIHEALSGAARGISTPGIRTVHPGLVEDAQGLADLAR